MNDDFCTGIPEVKSDAERMKEIKKVTSEAGDWVRDHLVPSKLILERSSNDAPAAMNIISLPAWLAVAERAGVPMVEAREIASMRTVDYILAMDNLGKEAEIEAFSEKIVSQLKDGEILRLEQVAPGDVKYELSQGNSLSGSNPSSPATNGLIRGSDGKLFPDIFGERFYTTLLDLGHDTIRAFARPFIQPLVATGTFPRGSERDGVWPVEFRVFVKDGEITGIANYYRQMDLDDQANIPDDIIKSAVNRSLEATRAMIATMYELGMTVDNKAMSDSFKDRGWKWGGMDFTLDFLQAEDGRVLFLEGGPPGLHYADPCAFLTEGAERIHLNGVALSTLRAPISLEDWEAGFMRPDAFSKSVDIEPEL
ncbi:hypothetical protein KUV57_11135 [Epibacterium sp. DP7N7-1]|nr:hypothetical protein [Epibacterium sp. DP7N7-1]